MDKSKFNPWIKTLPTRTIVVGEMEDGTPLTVEVHSMFAEADND